MKKVIELTAAVLTAVILLSGCVTLEEYVKWSLRDTRVLTVTSIGRGGKSESKTIIITGDQARRIRPLIKP